MSRSTIVSSKIVEDLKVQMSESGEIFDHGAEMSDGDVKTSSFHCSSTEVVGTASAVDDVEELKTSSVKAEIKDDGSEKVLPDDTDGEMTANVTDAADEKEEPEVTSTSTDDVGKLQLPDTFGTDINDLIVIRHDTQLPPLREGQNTVVLFDIEDHEEHPERVPYPYPCSLNTNNRYMWDRHYVRMPYAADNWEKIATVLKQINEPLHSWIVVEDAIKQYHFYGEALDFIGLEQYFQKKEAYGDCDTLLSISCLLDLIPKIAKLALDLPNACTRPVPLLRSQEDFTVAMSQYQVACLLANAFFCTFPPTASAVADVNFVGLFQQPRQGRCDARFAKLDCIFNYFRRVSTNMPTGIITFRRQVCFVVVLIVYIL